MQKFKVTDNGNANGTSIDRDGVVAGTSVKSYFLNDNFFNLFEFLTSQGYALIDGDTSQLAKANKSLYNATYIYNTSDIVEGSDGYYYKVLSDATTGDNPVGSVTGNWLKVPYDKLADINTLPAKTTPVDADVFVGADSADTFALKKFTWANLKATLKTYFDTLFVSKLPTVTGTATFTNSTNNILLVGIGSLTGLEIGDVIKVTDSVSNNKEFTVEVITDADNVIVNQAHAGGTTTKSLINETATTGVTVDILAKWYNATLGLGQGWVDVTTSRSTSTTYNNITNRTIISSVRANSAAEQVLNISVDNIIIDELRSNADASALFLTVSAAVAGNSDYDASSGGGIIRWVELR